jgi:hypothetical protein
MMLGIVAYAFLSGLSLQTSAYLADLGMGIAAYAFLSGLSLQTSAYLADLGMGVAAGGLCGMIMANLKKK